VVAWKNDQGIAPNICAMVPKRIANKQKIDEALQNMNWTADFRALSVTVLLEFIELFQQVDEVAIQPGVPDMLIWRLSSSGSYSTKSAYVAFFKGVVSFEPVDRIWKSWALGKCKFFMWLVRHNRCWTSDRFAKCIMDHPDHCSLCDQQEENINHLLLSCVFVRQFWNCLLRVADL
jgi:hypothetical protein